jgi:HSP20 family protein
MEEKKKRQSIFDLIRDYVEELEELKEGLTLPPAEHPSWNIRECSLEPLCSISVSTKEVTVTADLPYVQPSTIKVEPVNDDRLEITAEMKRKIKFEELGITHHEGEFSTFSCQTSIPVPVEMTHLTTSFKRGVLEIRLPRKRRHKTSPK